MVQGKMKDELKPTGFYTWVDVRDAAFAHVRSLEVPEAGGQRFLLMAGYQSNKQLAQIVASMNPKFKDLLPVDFEKSEEDIPGPGERYRFSNARSKEVLDIEYTSLETSVKDTVESLLKLGA